MPPEQPASDVSRAVQSRRHWRTAGDRRRARKPAAQRISEFQRARLLNAALELASAGGCEAATVTAVVSSAGVSRKTFYDLFMDRDDCLLALLNESFSKLADVVGPAWEAEGAWSGRLRAALIAALAFLDSERAAGGLVIAFLAGRGPRSPQLRTAVLERLQQAVDEGRSEAASSSGLSPLTAEFLVGGVLAVLDARLRERRRDLEDLLNQLIWMIVLPYRGPAAAGRELQRAAPARQSISGAPAADPLRKLGMRLTYRTARVLEAVARAPGASNAAVAAGADITDQGQMSKLLARLAGLGLIENVGRGQAAGTSNAWRLTDHGEHLEVAIRRKSAAGGS
jgi:AcrR family transcriptional regulator